MKDTGMKNQVKCLNIYTLFLDTGVLYLTVNSQLEKNPNNFDNSLKRIQ